MLFVLTGCNEPSENMQTHINSFSEVSKGEKLFDEKCSLCHLKAPASCTSKIEMTGPDMQTVSKEIIQYFTNEKGNFNKEKAIEFVSDYVYYPNEIKALLKQSQNRKYGIMPSLKGSVSQEELEEIADFIFTNLNNNN